MKAAAMVIALACLFGCAAKVPLQGISGTTEIPGEREKSFIPQEYAAFDGEGDATITGQVVTNSPAGTAPTGAGQEVLLNPVTTYSTEWYTRSILGGAVLETADVRASSYSKSTKTDEYGRFRFERLVPGSYYVTCVLEAPHARNKGSIGHQTPTRSVTVRTHARVLVKVGETATVVVTD